MKKIADERLAKVKVDLAKRGEAEAKSLAELLEQQRKRIAKANDDFDPESAAAAGHRATRSAASARPTAGIGRAGWRGSRRKSARSRRASALPTMCARTGSSRSGSSISGRRRVERHGERKSSAIPISNGWTMSGRSALSSRRSCSRSSASPPTRQTQVDSAVRWPRISARTTAKPALTDPWGFVARRARLGGAHVAGSPGGPPLPDEMFMSRFPSTTPRSAPTWAVKELGETERPWQLLCASRPPGVDPDARGTLDGWEATPHQRFERLLRETGVLAGVLISEQNERKDGEDRFRPELRLVYAPKGETSGYLSFPLRDLRDRRRPADARRPQAPARFVPAVH